MKTTQELNSTRLLRHLLRTDFFNAKDRANRGNIKAPKCTGSNHICGKVCLPPNKTCRISQAEVDEIVGEIEDQIRDRPVEYMAIVDSTNGELIGSNKGQRTTVDYPPGGIQAIRSRPPGTVIITHNHPNVLNGPPGSEAWKGLTFSNNDLVAASQLRLKEMRAVSNGYNHSVSPNNDQGRWPDSAVIGITYQKSLNSTYQEVLQDIQSGKTSLFDAESELQHRAMQKTTQDLGLVYTRTPVRRKRQDSINPDILRRVAQKRLNRGVNKANCETDHEVAKQRKTDSLRVDAEVVQKNALKRQIEQQARSILGRIYKGKVITRIVAEKIQDNGSVFGLFWDKEGNQFSFAIANGEVLYKLMKTGRRDSLVFVEDKRTGDRKTGVKCGDGWISADYVCRKAGSQAPQKEIAALNQSAQQFAQLSAPDLGDTNAGIKPQKVDRKELEGKTIRELQKIGRETGVVNTNSMPKDKLINAIVVAKEDPEQQARVRKTLERKREVRREVKGIPAAKALQDWQKFNRILKAAGVSTPLAGIAMMAFINNRTRTQIEKAKNKYQETLGEAAKDAETRAKGMPTEAIEKDNIMFVVSGFRGEGSSAQKLQDALLQGGDERDQELYEAKSHIVPYDLTDDIPEFVGKSKRPDGRQTRGYDAYYAANSARKFFQNYSQGHSEDAVELAAKLYAYSNHKETEPGEKGKTTYPNQGKRINILAHSAGGNIVHEALDILKQMDSVEGGVKGATVLKNINVMNLGTPSLGFTEDLSKKPREIGGIRTITPKRDRISNISPRNPTYTDQVKGRTIDDFMKSDFVREQMRRAFGYYRG